MSVKLKLVPISIIAASILFVGCGSSNNISIPKSSSNTQDKSGFFNKLRSIASTKMFKSRIVNIQKEMQKDMKENAGENKDMFNSLDIATSHAPNIKSLKKYVDFSDVEQSYYYNLIDTYISNIDNIKIKTIKKTIDLSHKSLEDIKADLKKENKNPMFNNDMILTAMAKKLKEKYKKPTVVTQTVLEELPKDATNSLVEFNTHNNKVTNEAGTLGSYKNIITINYKLNSKEEALDKLAQLTSKIKLFLSHDKDWAIDDSTSQNAMKKDMIKNKDLINEHIKDMKKDIKIAKSKGEDTTTLEAGLENYINYSKGKVSRSTRSGFIYSYYLNDKKHKHSIRIMLHSKHNNTTIQIIRANSVL